MTDRSEPLVARSPQGSAVVEAHVSDERSEWLVLTLHGSFSDHGALALVRDALLGAVLSGACTVAVDARRATLSVAAYEVLVSAAEVLDGCDGVLVVSGISAFDAAMLRCMDEAKLLVAAPRTTER